MSIATKHALCPTVVLPDGTEVPKALHDELRRQVERAIPTLQRGREYAIGQMAEAAFWRPIAKGLRSRLGKCLAHWVARRELALEFVGCPRCNAKRYVRR
jgi:hypothetical protein